MVVPELGKRKSALLTPPRRRRASAGLTSLSPDVCANRRFGVWGRSDRSVAVVGRTEDPVNNVAGLFFGPVEADCQIARCRGHRRDAGRGVRDRREEPADRTGGSTHAPPRCLQDWGASQGTAGDPRSGVGNGWTAGTCERPAPSPFPVDLGNRFDSRGLHRRSPWRRANPSERASSARRPASPSTSICFAWTGTPSLMWRARDRSVGAQASA